MDSKLESLRMQNDKSGYGTFRDIKRQMDLIPTVMEENEDDDVNM